MIKLGKIKPGKDEEYVYKVDFANLIRNLNDSLYKMIINPTRDVINEKSQWIFYESCLDPNKIQKKRKYPRNKGTKGKKHSRAYAKM